MPSRPGHSAAQRLAARRGRTRRRASWAMAIVGGPSRRTRRVSARVSTPEMPMRPVSAIHVGKSRFARKLLGLVTASRTMAPSAWAAPASTSSALAPTLPMWGKVKVTTCARVAGVGHHLLIAGHRGVEAQLADRLALGAEAPAPDDPAVGEDDHAGRTCRDARAWIVDRPSRKAPVEKSAMSLSHGR